MATRVLPQIGHWYSHRDKGLMFQVVALDDGGYIEIQDYDGDVDELDLDSWLAMPLEPAAPPDDRHGPWTDIDDGAADASSVGGGATRDRWTQIIANSMSADELPPTEDIDTLRDPLPH